MAKRQVKVTIDQLHTYILQNEALNFILKDRKVLHLRPNSLDGENLKAKNGMGQTMILPLHQIEEIWADIPARQTK